MKANFLMLHCTRLGDLDEMQRQIFAEAHFPVLMIIYAVKIVRIILLQQTEPQDVYGADRFELLIVLAESAFAELCPVVKRAPQHVGFVGHLDFNVYGFSGVKNAGHVKAGEFGLPGFSPRFALNVNFPLKLH